MFTESELKGKKLPELKEIGATLKVEKAKTLKKPDLIAGILKAFADAPAEEKPTPTPTPLPPGDLGYELVRHTFTVNLTDIGQVTTVGIPSSLSPIVDSDQDNDLMDEVKIATDPQNYTILKVTHNRNSISEITFLSLTPTGNTTVTFDFYTINK